MRGRTKRTFFISIESLFQVFRILAFKHQDFGLNFIMVWVKKFCRRRDYVYMCTQYRIITFWVSEWVSDFCLTPIQQFFMARTSKFSRPGFYKYAEGYVIISSDVCLNWYHLRCIGLCFASEKTYWCCRNCLK
jgi:hypothetical protein